MAIMSLDPHRKLSIWGRKGLHWYFHFTRKKTRLEEMRCVAQVAIGQVLCSHCLVRGRCGYIWSRVGASWVLVPVFCLGGRGVWRVGGQESLLSSPREELGQLCTVAVGWLCVNLISGKRTVASAKICSPLCWWWYRTLKIQGKDTQNREMTK